MQIRNYLPLLFVSMCPMSPLMAQSDNDEPVQAAGVVPVASTDFARLRSAQDVLNQLSAVMVDADGIVTVMGHGVARVYVDNRMLTSPGELSRISAAIVKEVEVITDPGAAYDKDVRAVIIVRLIEGKTEGLYMDDRLLMDMKRVPAFSNQMGMRYKFKEMEVFSQLSIDEVREHRYTKDFTQSYEDSHKLLSRQVTEAWPRDHKQTLSALVGMNIDLTASQSLSLAYEGDWVRFENTRNYKMDVTYQANVQGVLNLQHPLNASESYERNHKQAGAHDLRATYAATFGDWKLDVGYNNIFAKREEFDNGFSADGKQTGNSVFIRDYFYLRDYAHAEKPVGKGKLQMGLEHTLTKQDLSLENRLKKQPLIDGSLKAIQYAAYANIGQQLSNWHLSAGLRYEHIDFSFDPSKGSANLPQTVAEKYSDDYFYPNASVGVKVGQSDLELSYTRSYQKPDMQNLHQTQGGVYYMESMQDVERISTTQLSWQHKWLMLSASYLRFDDPYFHSQDGKIDFTGNDYDAMDFDLALSPTFGWWKPALSAHYHRQWLYMGTANGRNSLTKPFVNIGFTNTLSLPQDWMVRANAYWHSKGDVRNQRYQGDNFDLSASVLKDLCNHHLTIEVSLYNALRSSWTDMTKYADVNYNQSKGDRKRNVRNLAVSVIYKF